MIFGCRLRSNGNSRVCIVLSTQLYDFLTRNHHHLLRNNDFLTLAPLFHNTYLKEIFSEFDMLIIIFYFSLLRRTIYHENGAAVSRCSKSFSDFFKILLVFFFFNVMWIFHTYDTCCQKMNSTSVFMVIIIFASTVVGQTFYPIFFICYFSFFDYFFVFFFFVFKRFSEKNSVLYE